MQLVIIPGLGNSGPEHWQTLWENKFPGSVRVNQHNWENPDRESWVESLQAVIAAAEGDILLIAHSLGVALVAHWAARHRSERVRGALLVSPSDVDSPVHTPDSVRGFAPMPLAPLPFKSVIVTSSDDTFVTPARAEFFAQQWRAEFVAVGALGHINAASGIGDWPAGQKLLARFAAP